MIYVKFSVPEQSALSILEIVHSLLTLLSLLEEN